MTEHPDTEQLLAYLEHPEDAPFKHLRRHLLACHHCRTRSTQLSVFSANINKIPMFNTDVIDDSVAVSIAALVDGDLADEKKVEMETLLKNDPRLEKVALHYTLNQRVYERENYREQGTPIIRQKNSPNWLASIKHFFNGQHQTWVTATITVGLTLAITWFVITPVSQDNTGLVASYQDDPMIYFKQPKKNIPGIGFFGSANNNQMKFSGLSISKIDHRYQFAWEKIPEAENYSLDIYQISAEKVEEIASRTIKLTTLALTSTLFQSGSRYAWHLHGNLNDGTSFETKGGFVTLK